MASVVTAVVLSLVVLGIIGGFTLEGTTLSRIARVNPLGLLLAAMTVAVRVLCGTWRLHFVSKGRLKWAGALRAQLAWDFFSNVTPSTIGGGPITPAYIVRDSHIRLGEATSIMLFAMLMDQIWFALAIVVVLVSGFWLEIIPAALGRLGNVTFTVYFLAFMFWVCLFGYATLVRPRILERFMDMVFRLRWLNRIHRRVLDMMAHLREHAHVLRTQRPGFYVKGFVLTVLVWLSRYLLVVVLLWSVFPNVDVLLAFFRTVAMMLGALVLPTPGGTGGIEGLYALMVGPLIPDALLAVTLFSWRLLGYYVFVAAGVYLTVRQADRALRGKKSETSAIQSELRQLRS